MTTAAEPALLWAIAILFGSLCIGSIIRFIALRNAETATRKKRLASLRTWWMLAALVSVGLLFGRLGICLLLLGASCAAWNELTRMLGPREEDRLAIHAGYVLIVLNYTLILLDKGNLYLVFLPVAGILVLAFCLLSQGEPKGYISSAGALLWGLLFLGYGVSHAAYLTILPAASTGPMGPAGWILFLVILTESDDIFQAVIGRLFGSHKRHRISPVISPNKTWEGFIGGFLVILVLALLLAPWFTTLTAQAGPINLPDSLQAIVAPALVAVLISIAGFFGDINMSAIKRDSGVKDSSGMLPGMGGIIDRIDSISMTAPVYVYFIIGWSGV